MKEQFSVYKPIWKRWWFWVGVVVLVCGAFWWNLNINYNARWMEKYGAENLSVQNMYDDIARRKAARDDAYKNDTYGGKTPQETWNMFVAALEAGDTDLAAKYFVVEMQDEMTRILKKASELGNIEILLSDFELIVGGDMYDNQKMFEFYTDDIDDGPGFVYVLVLNEQTGLWKIKDL